MSSNIKGEDRKIAFFMKSFVVVFVAVVAFLGLIILMSITNERNRPNLTSTNAPAVSETVGSDEAVKISLASIITIGNHSWMPFPKAGEVADNPEKILVLVDLFERNHPEWEIIGWRVEYKHQDYNKAFIYGLWIDYRPKVETADKSSKPFTS